MPYKSTEELPASVRKLPTEAQKMWMKVFNSAAEQYSDESRVFATAWAAVNKKYGTSEAVESLIEEYVGESDLSTMLSFGPKPTPEQLQAKRAQAAQRKLKKKLIQDLGDARFALEVAVDDRGRQKWSRAIKRIEKELAELG